MLIDLPVHKNLWSPGDTTRKYTRPGVELACYQGWVLFVPVIASNPKYGFPLLGPACEDSALMKNSSANNFVVAVREDSIWSGHRAQIGWLRLGKDLHFAQRFADYVLDSQCVMLDYNASELPHDLPDSAAPLRYLPYRCDRVRRVIQRLALTGQPF